LPLPPESPALKQADGTKMFHVKHFGTIDGWAKNTSAKARRVMPVHGSSPDQAWPWCLQAQCVLIV